MNELTLQEIDEVSGGIIPLAAAGLGVAIASAVGGAVIAGVAAGWTVASAYYKLNQP
jgi:lactobin A/cerein 7B family class IIb bacteriocin